MTTIRMLLAAPLALTLALTAPAMAEERTVPQSRTQMQLSFAPLVKQVENAVVNVYAERVVERRSIFEGDPFFEQFFGQRMPNRSHVVFRQTGLQFLRQDRPQQFPGSSRARHQSGFHEQRLVAGSQPMQRVVLPFGDDFALALFIAEKDGDVAVRQLVHAKNKFFTVNLVDEVKKQTVALHHGDQGDQLLGGYVAADENVIKRWVQSLRAQRYRVKDLRRAGLRRRGKNVFG